MARQVPKIDGLVTLKKRDREGFKDFVLNVIKDTFVYQYMPDSVVLDESETLFTLTLQNKRFVIDFLEIDNVEDYIDVYLYGVKEPQERYQVTGSYADVVGNDIVINFTQDITRVPTAVVEEFESGIETFVIKGKIVEVNTGS